MYFILFLYKDYFPSAIFLKCDAKGWLLSKKNIKLDTRLLKKLSVLRIKEGNENTGSKIQLEKHSKAEKVVRDYGGVEALKFV